VTAEAKDNRRLKSLPTTAKLHTMAKKSAKPAVRLHCSQCGDGLRNHRVLKEHSVPWAEEGIDIEWVDTYQIVQCLGCDAVRFRHRYTDSENNDEVKVYPDANPSRRRLVPQLVMISTVGKIYRETMAAYNAKAPVLAGGGLRAIVEAICKDQGIAGRDLQDKIDALVKKGLLAKPQADLLHEERFIGNAALHELAAPANDDLKIGLDIIESLLTTIYVLPGKAKRLQAARTKRKRTESMDAASEAS
jgi:hypothetical protein